MKTSQQNRFTYDKGNLQSGYLKSDRPVSKFSFLVQLFVATFVVIFIALVIMIMKVSTKVDIEYTHGDMGYSEAESDIFEDDQRRIDKRLILIQQEENAPSEAKILASEKSNNEVINPMHVEQNRLIDKANMLQEKKEKKENKISVDRAEVGNLVVPDKKPLVQLMGEIKEKPKEKETDISLANQNVTIMSKVLVGRFFTFDDAKRAQADVKSKVPTYTPFVRKVGDVYTLQMGSFQDFNVAKKVARELKLVGLDVWIYQQ